MAQRFYGRLFIALALFGLAADQASKYGVFRALANGGRGGSVELVPGYFEFLAQFDYRAEPCDCPLVNLNGPVPPRVNHGALFGLGGEHTKLANRVFAGISLVAAVAIIWWASRRRTRQDGLLSAALGLILGGTLGNLYDRVVFGGVRDFMHFYIERGGRTVFDWPVFNVADCALVCGAGLLLIQALFTKQQPDEAAGATAHEMKDAGVV